MIGTLLIISTFVVVQTESLDALKWNWCCADGETTTFIQMRPFDNVYYFSHWTVRNGVTTPDYVMVVVNDSGNKHRGWTFYADGSRGESDWQPIERAWESHEVVHSANGKTKVFRRLMLGKTAETWEFTRNDGKGETKKTYRRVNQTVPLEPKVAGAQSSTLHPLSPLVGLWDYSNEEPRAERPDTTSWSPWSLWILDGHFVLGWVREFGGRDSIAITGRDIVDRNLKTWVFRTDGGRELHTVLPKHSKGTWETRFTGVDGQGKGIEGSGSYSNWMSEQPPKIHLKYEESRSIGGGREVNWSVSANRSRIVPSDRLPATAGQEVLVTDNIPGEGIDGYWLYLPKNHNQQEKWPLIIYLHGASRVVGQLVDTKHLGPIGYASGQREPAEKNSKLMRKKFVIVSPHLAKDIFWWSQWKDQTETIDAIVDSLIANYAVDPDRIYVTGISRGGYGTWAYASRTKHQLAAIVPICGGSRGVEQWSKLDNLAIWAVHNEHDPVVPYYQSANAVKEIQDLCGKKFKPLKNAAPGKKEKYLSEQRLFTTFDRDGHDAWTETYSHPHVYRWLLKQRAGD